MPWWWWLRFVVPLSFESVLVSLFPLLAWGQSCSAPLSLQCSAVFRCGRRGACTADQRRQVTNRSGSPCRQRHCQRGQLDHLCWLCAAPCVLSSAVFATDIRVPTTDPAAELPAQPQRQQAAQQYFTRPLPLRPRPLLLLPLLPPLLSLSLHQLRSPLRRPQQHRQPLLSSFRPLLPPRPLPRPP